MSCVAEWLRFEQRPGAPVDRSRCWSTFRDRSCGWRPATAPRGVRAGEIVTFASAGEDVGDDAGAGRLPGFPAACDRALGDRDRRWCAAPDGRVVGTWGGGVAERCRRGASPRKGINVTYARPELPAITDKDLQDLAVAAELGADLVALSFVRSAADIEQLRSRLDAQRRVRGRSRRSRRSRRTRTWMRSSPSPMG